MTQPSFVPIADADQVRPALRLEEPGRWVQDRPAELRFPVRRSGRHVGAPGPDQGYALRLARRAEARLVLGEGESAEDAVVGTALLAARRAAMFGRAPSVHDVDAVTALWGLRDPAAPAALVEVRRQVFAGVAHDYVAQRSLVDRVPERGLRQQAAEIADAVRAGEWPALTGDQPLA